MKRTAFRNGDRKHSLPPLSKFLDLTFSEYLKRISFQNVEFYSTFPHRYCFSGEFCVQVLDKPVLVSVPVSNDSQNTNSSQNQNKPPNQKSSAQETLFYFLRVSDFNRVFFIIVPRQWAHTQSFTGDPDDLQNCIFVVKRFMIWIASVENSQLIIKPLNRSQVNATKTSSSSSSLFILFQPKIFLLKLRCLFPLLSDGRFGTNSKKNSDIVESLSKYTEAMLNKIDECLKERKENGVRDVDNVEIVENAVNIENAETLETVRVTENVGNVENAQTLQTVKDVGDSSNSANIELPNNDTELTVCENVSNKEPNYQIMNYPGKQPRLFKYGFKKKLETDGKTVEGVKVVKLPDFSFYDEEEENEDEDKYCENESISNGIPDSEPATSYIAELKKYDDPMIYIENGKSRLNQKPSKKANDIINSSNPDPEIKALLRPGEDLNAITSLDSPYLDHLRF